MSFGQITLSLKTSLARLQANRQSEAIRIASNGLALVARRVQQTGRDAEGQSFSPYSQKQVPKYFFYGRSRSAGADARVKKAKTPTLSYADFRELNNLETGHKSFSFTGRLWLETGVTLLSSVGSQTTVEVGGRTDYSKKLWSYHAAKNGGSILRNSDREFNLMVEAFRLSREKAIKL